MTWSTAADCVNYYGAGPRTQHLSKTRRAPSPRNQLRNTLPVVLLAEPREGRLLVARLGGIRHEAIERVRVLYREGEAFDEGAMSL